MGASALEATWTRGDHDILPGSGGSKAIHDLLVVDTGKVEDLKCGLVDCQEWDRSSRSRREGRPAVDVLLPGLRIARLPSKIANIARQLGIDRATSVSEKKRTIFGDRLLHSVCL